MKYRVKLQYPWSTYYEVEVEVEADSVDEAENKALAMEKQDGFWDHAYQVGDGDAGDTEVWEVTSVE